MTFRICITSIGQEIPCPEKQFSIIIGKRFSCYKACAFQCAVLYSVPTSLFPSLFSYVVWEWPLKCYHGNAVRRSTIVYNSPCRGSSARKNRARWRQQVARVTSSPPIIRWVAVIEQTMYESCSITPCFYLEDIYTKMKIICYSLKIFVRSI